MANILIWITSVLLLVSAYLSYKNHQMLGEETRLKESSAKQLADNREELQGKRDDRDGIKEDLEETIDATKIAQEKEEAANQKVADLSVEIEEKQRTAEQKESALASLQSKEAQLKIFKEELPKINALENEKNNLRDSLNELESQLATLLNQREATQASRETLSEYDSKFTSGESFFSSARITGIYPTWGFVTLSAGNSSGVVTGTDLNVVRDGEVVAKLRVRTVETSRSSADVIPESMEEGVTLMVGDRVVPAERKDSSSSQATASN